MVLSRSALIEMGRRLGAKSPFFYALAVDTFLVLTARPAELPFVAAIFVLGIGFVFGATWGSFLNVVIARVPKGESVVHPRSRCPACGTQIRATDNVPVLSWLLLRGKCRACQAPISWRYPLIELMLGMTGAAAVARYGLSVDAVELYAFVAILVAIAFVDLDTWTVPHPLWIALVISGLGFGALTGLRTGAWTVLVDRAIGAIGGGLLLGSVVVVATYVYRRLGRIDGETTAMGWGDPCILIGVGACLGWQALPLVVFLASLQGAIVGLVLKRRGALEHAAPVSEDDDWVPPAGAVQFGPFLALGALEAAFFGDAILGWASRILALPVSA